MALDRNWFDSFLKEKPWRDLVFRAVVWSAVSALSAVLALRSGLSPGDLLDRLATSLSPVTNAIGTLALCLAVPALAFKDLEFHAPDSWNQGTRRGRIGGVFRRVAGDLLLWTLGAFCTVVGAILIAITIEGVGPDDVAVIAGALLQLFLITAGVTYATLLVRREGPSPMIRLCRRPRSLVLIYGFIIIGVLAALVRAN